MKKLIGCFLIVYLLLNVLVPCTQFDNCSDEVAAKQADADQEGDCNSCSPFSVCSSSSVIIASRISFDSIRFIQARCYQEHPVSSGSDYHSSLFQPPRAG